MNLRGGWIFLSLGLLRQLLVCLFWLLSVSRLPGPVVSLFCLQAEQGLSLPVSALSLLSQQVISPPLSAAISPLPTLLSNTHPGLSRIVLAVLQDLRQSSLTFLSVVGDQAFRGLCEEGESWAHTDQKLLASWKLLLCFKNQHESVIIGYSRG